MESESRSVNFLATLQTRDTLGGSVHSKIPPAKRTCEHNLGA